LRNGPAMRNAKSSTSVTVSDSPDFYTGSVIEAEDLRFRDAFIADLWETLKSSHVLLKAPRRCGKTSIMEHLRRRPSSGFVVVYENVQDLSHPADFFLAILDKFHDAHPAAFHSIIKGWKSVVSWLPETEEVGLGEFKLKFREHEEDYREQWRQHGETLFARLRSLEQPVLIIVDELPDMLLNLKREDPKLLRDFLSWFRTQRSNPTPKQDNVRWLLGGSINLSTTLDGMGLLDRINDLQDVPLPDLTPANVEEFVGTMLSNRGVPFEKRVPPRLCVLLGRPIPLFLQMLTQELHRSWKAKPRKLKSADVDAEFARLITNTSAQDKLQHFYTRLAKYYEEPALGQAHALLNHLCRTGTDGASRSALQQVFDSTWPAGKLPAFHERKRLFVQLLRDLGNDFYVVETADDRCDFASGIIKAWWRKYYA
jgi:hypothetical protein